MEIIKKTNYLYIFLICVISIVLIGCQDTTEEIESSTKENDTEEVEKSNQEEADFILQNGNVYTVDEDNSWAESVAVKGEEIVAVGTNEEIQALQGEETEVIDLDGKMVLPGFFDSHTHAASAVNELYTADLNHLNTIEEYQEVLQEFIEENPDAEAVRGRGWINGCCDEFGPRKEDIDEIIPDIPVILTAEDGHSVWVNSKALEMAGITKDTPDPEKGVLERDPDTGEPLGTLREEARSLVSDVIKDYTIEEYKEGILTFQDLAAQRGITSVHVLLGRGNSYEAFKELEEEEKLTVRYRGSFTAVPGEGTEQIKEIAEERDKNTGDLFQTHSVKIFTDGVIEGGTAYLEEPYKHKDSRGDLEWEDRDEFNEVFAAIDKEELQIHVHSIGDAATRITLDGIEYAQEQNGERDSRHGITHIQLVNEEDYERFNELGVLAYPQPFWHMKETGYYEEIEVPYLGRERAEKEYPMKSFFDADVVVASGSDYTVTPEFSPIYGMQYGVTRTEFEYGDTDPDDPESVANPDEIVSLEEMIESFTINGAYADFTEDITGSIEEGKRADLVILEENLFDVPENEISETKVLLTLFEGDEVYRDPSFE